MTFSLVDVDLKADEARAFAGADLASLPGRDLMEALRAATAGQRAWELVVAQVAGEIARRSTVEDGPRGLARQQGFASPQQLVASVAGSSYGEGAKLVTAGVLLAEARPLADALGDGSLSAAKADLIATTLKGLGGDTDELEARLTRAARTLDYGRLKLACRREAARHDATQLEGRERRQHQARCLEITEDTSGMAHLRGDLDPVSAAVIRTFLDAQVKAALQARRDGPQDARTAGQIRADALVALAAHGLDCTAKASGVKATIVVRIDRDDLERDVGIASCDAIATPISLGALRQLAVDASILPVVMGANAQPLDMGREERLFNWSQRMALAARDGGCAKCHAPISHCVTHHIRWWSRDGRSDLQNGVLLCTRCHTQLHHDGWGVEVDDANQVWFTTPAHLDPGRTRILGGLAALTIG